MHDRKKSDDKYRASEKGKAVVKKYSHTLTRSKKSAAYAKKYSKSKARLRRDLLRKKINREFLHTEVKPDYHLFPNTRAGKVAACLAKTKEIKSALKKQYEKKYS